MKYFKIFICIFLLILVFNLYIEIYNKKINDNNVFLLGKLIYIEANYIVDENKKKDNSYIPAIYQNTGIVTCIDDNNKFISVGHCVANGNEISGNCYQTKRYEIEKSKDGFIGSIRIFDDVSDL